MNKTINDPLTATHLAIQIVALTDTEPTTPPRCGAYLRLVQQYTITNSKGLHHG